MEKNILIKGKEEFLCTLCKKLYEYEKFVRKVNYSSNEIIIDGMFEPKEILFKGNLLDEKVFWKLEDDIVDINDIDALIKKQNDAMGHCNWKLVKLINKIIMEVETHNKEKIIHYYPTKIQVEHSTICNAKCIMCTHYFTNNYRRTFISDKVIENIVDILPYIDKVLLHGVGEAFLHPNITQYLELYSKYDVEVSCVTNMSYMDNSLAEIIGKTFKTLTISCDGATKETFEGIRRGISFENFCANIKMLHEKKPDLELRFNVVCMRQNICEMPKIIELASELGVSAVGISGLITQKVLDNVDDDIKQYPKVSSFYIKQALTKAEELNIKMLQFPRYIFSLESSDSFEEEMFKLKARPFYHDEAFQKELYERYRKMDVVKPTREANKNDYAIASDYGCVGICDYFVESPFIGVTGEMTTCCIDGIHIMGDLKERSFIDIWNSDVYQKMRNIFYNNKIPKFCVGCMFLKDNNKIERLNLNNADEGFLKHEFSDLIDSSDSEE